jgi:ABC-2 type transport system permease protein
MSDGGPAGKWHGAAPMAAATCRPLLAGLADWVTMAGPGLRLTRRNPDAVITSLALPVLLMLLFVYLFGGAIQTGTRYVTYVVPGVLLLCAGFGASMTAVGVTNDMTGGIIDRFRSMDVAGASVLAGHVAASVVRNLASTVLVFGVAFLVGFRPSAGPLDWVAAAGVLLLFILAISWLAAAVGLLARSPEAAGGFSFLVMFLPYPSSAFVPIHTMPTWLHGFADNQPVTPVIETLRGLLLGLPVGTAHGGRSPGASASWSPRWPPPGCCSAAAPPPDPPRAGRLKGPPAGRGTRMAPVASSPATRVAAGPWAHHHRPTYAQRWASARSSTAFSPAPRNSSSRPSSPARAPAGSSRSGGSAPPSPPRMAATARSPARRASSGPFL